jgi:restriction system protein
MGDLSNIQTPEELEEKYDETYSDESPVQRGLQLGGIRKFRFDMSPGDQVISYDPGTREYHWGTITSDYKYQPNRVGDYPQIREVKWEHRISRDALSQSTRNGLTVLATITQPNQEVRKEFEVVLSGQTLVQDEQDLAEKEFVLENQVEKARELIKDRLSQVDWDTMQELVAAILRAMGYKTRVSPAGPDKGKDIVASPDGLGLEEPRVKVEVKHRKGTIGAPEVRAFLGGLRQGDRGLYVSTGGFTKEAEYEAERAAVPVTLIDLDMLAGLLTQYYDSIDMVGRAIIPLTRILWPTD